LMRMNTKDKSKKKQIYINEQKTSFSIALIKKKQRIILKIECTHQRLIIRSYSCHMGTWL
jgi:hypothetical protein